MCKLRNLLVAVFAILHLTACASAIKVELAVSKAQNAIATIKPLAGQANPNPSSCVLPCQLQLDKNSKYEISINSDGYYPAAIKLDYNAAFATARALYPREYRVPLVIPLIENKNSH